MNTVRMRIVERVLQQVVHEDWKFNMSNWFGDDAGLRADCGTTACAAGWTARDPEANAQGLIISRYSREPAFFVNGQWEFGCRAMATWLEVDYTVSVRLFTSGYYDAPSSGITPQMVLERVQEELSHPLLRYSRLD